jgi:hypothetical protein
MKSKCVSRISGKAPVHVCSVAPLCFAAFLLIVFLSGSISAAHAQAAGSSKCGELTKYRQGTFKPGTSDNFRSWQVAPDGKCVDFLLKHSGNFTNLSLTQGATPVLKCGTLSIGDFGDRFAWTYTPNPTMLKCWDYFDLKYAVQMKDDPDTYIETIHHSVYIDLLANPVPPPPPH